MVTGGGGVIFAAGTSDDEFETACKSSGINPARAIDASGKTSRQGTSIFTLMVLGGEVLTMGFEALIWRVRDMQCMVRQGRCFR